MEAVRILTRKTEQEEDRHLTALVREYWASGNAVGGRGSKRWDEHGL